MTTTDTEATTPPRGARRTNWPDVDRTEGRAPKATQGRTGSAYATPAQLTSLAEYIQAINSAASETGWHAPNMIVSFGDVEEEAIVVGIRWFPHMGGYVVEIR